MKKAFLYKLTVFFMMLVLTAGLFALRVSATDAGDPEVPGVEETTEASAEDPTVTEAVPAETETEAAPAETSTEAPKPAVYTISVTNGKACLEDGTEVTEAEEGTQITISPTVSANQEFDHWEIDGIDGLSPEELKNATMRFQIRKNVVCRAVLTEKPPVIYSINVIGGKSSLSTATAGTVVTVRADSFADGETFGYWEIRDAGGTRRSEDRELKLTVPESDVTVTLHKKYLVKVEGGKAASSGVEASSHVSILPGANVSVRSHEESRKGFFAWLITGLSGVESTYDETYLFTMPESPVSLKIQYGGDVTVTDNAGRAFPDRAQEKTEITLSQPVIPDGKAFDHWEVRVKGQTGVTELAEEISTFTMPANDVTVTLVLKDAETEPAVTESEAPTGYYYIDRYRIHKYLNGAEAPEDFVPSSDGGTFPDSMEAFYSSAFKLFVYWTDRGSDETADYYVYDSCNATMIPYTRFTADADQEFIITTPANKLNIPGKLQSDARIAVANDGDKKLMAPGFVTVTEKNQKVNVVYLCDTAGKRDYYVVTSEDDGIVLQPYREYVDTHEAVTESETPTETESVTESVPTSAPTEEATEPPAEPENGRNPYTFWIILVSVILLLVITAIILVIYYNKKQEEEELETDFDENDPKEAFELFDRVKRRDRLDSDYHQNEGPAEDFDVSFENAFPAEMGIAAAVRETDDEEDMAKKFTNDYPMQEIEDITDEIAGMSAAELLAGDTQRIELDQEDIAKAVPEEIPEGAADMFVPLEEAAAVTAAAAETGAETLETGAETVEAGLETAAETAETAVETASETVEEAAGMTETAAESAAEAFTETADETADVAEETVEAAAETVENAAETPGTEDVLPEEPENPVAEDPAIERLKHHLSGELKSDEEIAKNKTLKKVTYKDILLDDDFEEIEFRKSTTQE